MSADLIWMVRRGERCVRAQRGWESVRWWRQRARVRLDSGASSSEESPRPPLSRDAPPSPFRLRHAGDMTASQRVVGGCARGRQPSQSCTRAQGARRAGGWMLLSPRALSSVCRRCVRVDALPVCHVLYDCLCAAMAGVASGARAAGLQGCGWVALGAWHLLGESGRTATHTPYA